MTGAPEDGASRGKALERLLRKPAPPDYLAAWTRALAGSAFARLEATDAASLLVRAGDQRLALALPDLEEVHPLVAVRRVPGRTNPVFRGLVNLRGALHLCGDLHALLHVATPPPTAGPDTAGRLVRIAHAGRSWTFAVDAVEGVERHGAHAATTPLATVERARVHYTAGLLRVGDRRAARLDARRVVEAFEEALR